MNPATSPVKAPSAISVAQFCAETLMFEPSRRSATLFSAVNTGAMIISQWLAFATSGLSASAVETESATVLYIFQFPAMIGFRIDLWLAERRREVLRRFVSYVFVALRFHWKSVTSEPAASLTQ